MSLKTLDKCAIFCFSSLKLLYHTKINMYFSSIFVTAFFFLVAACLRDLRNEAVVFLAGIVRHITSVAVVQQCCMLY